jgi:hypothetical protein
MKTYRFIFLYHLNGKNGVEEHVDIAAMDERYAWRNLVKNHSAKFEEEVYGRTLYNVRIMEV